MKVSQSNDISFQSNISILSKVAFKEVQKLGIDHLLEVRESVGLSGVVTASCTFTRGIMQCLSGGIIQNGKVSQFHFYPAITLKRIEKFTQDIEARLRQISKDEGKIKGLLIGGTFFEKDKLKSLKLFNILKNIVKKLKKEGHEVDFTILFGQQLFVDSDLMYLARNDHWIIGKDRVLRLQDLKKAFKYRNLSPNDKLGLPSGWLTREDVQKLAQEKSDQFIRVAN